MDLDQMLKNIDDNAQAELEASKSFYADMPEGQGTPTRPEDIYQRDATAIADNAKKKYPKGSSKIVNIALYEVLNGNGAEGLAHAYARAKDDEAALIKSGERERASILRKQYMAEHFLPALEIVINSSSPDEVLNSAQAINTLDKYVLLEGDGKGYTASYIRQAYGDQLGQAPRGSEPEVKRQIGRINRMLDIGENRAAYSLAKKLKQQIDRGEKLADDIDYDLLGRIVAYS